MSNEGKPSARRRKFGKITAWLLVIVGFFTLLPINVGRPNFLRAFTLCSFAPVATITMFIVALTVYWYSKKSDLIALGVIALLLITVLSGIWAYSTKLPLDSVDVNMVVDKYYFGQWYPDEGNISRMFLNLTLHNPTTLNTPSFLVEYYDLFVQTEKLQLFTYDVFPEGVNMYIGTRYLTPVMWLGPNQNVTMDVEITIFNDTKVEGDMIERIWPSLASGNFTVRMDAILISRSYYGPESDEYLVMASKPFSVSSVYQG